MRMHLATGTLTIVKSADLSLVLGGIFIITTTEESLQSVGEMSRITITTLRIIRRNNSVRMATIGVDEMNITITRVLRDIGTLKEVHLAERWHHGSGAPPLLRSAGIVNTINICGKQRSITDRKRIWAEAGVATEKDVHTIMINWAATLVNVTHSKTEAGATIIAKGAQLHKGGLRATKVLRIGITMIMNAIIGIMRVGITRARVATEGIEKGFTIIINSGLRAIAIAIENSTIIMPQTKRQTKSLSMPSRTPNSSSSSILHTLPTHAYPP
jgi:hypothetical protein